MSELVREIVEVAAMVGGDADDPLLIVEADGLAPTFFQAEDGIRDLHQ